MIAESKIVHQCGDFWVFVDHDAYRVMRDGATHSTEDSAYEKTPGGLSLARARSNYKGKRP